MNGRANSLHEKGFSPAMRAAHPRAPLALLAAVFIAAICLFPPAVSGHAASVAHKSLNNPTIVFEPSELSLSPGDLCTLSVFIDGAVESLGCMDISVAFDTSLVQFIKAREGMLFGGAIFPTYFQWELASPDTANAIDCVLGYRSFALAPGELAGFIFQAKRAGVCPISFGLSRLWDIDRNEIVPATGGNAELFISDPTGIETAVPRAVLLRNYPNPFNPTTTIILTTSRAGWQSRNERISLCIYTLSGGRVRSFGSATECSGICECIWNGRDDDGHQAAAGVYLSVARIGPDMLTRKLVLVR